MLTGETWFHCEFVHLWDVNRWPSRWEANGWPTGPVRLCSGAKLQGLHKGLNVRMWWLKGKIAVAQWWGCSGPMVRLQWLNSEIAGLNDEIAVVQRWNCYGSIWNLVLNGDIAVAQWWDRDDSMAKVTQWWDCSGSLVQCGDVAAQWWVCGGPMWKSGSSVWKCHGDRCPNFWMLWPNVGMWWLNIKMWWEIWWVGG